MVSVIVILAWRLSENVGSLRKYLCLHPIVFKNIWRGFNACPTCLPGFVWMEVSRGNEETMESSQICYFVLHLLGPELL